MVSGSRYDKLKNSYRFRTEKLNQSPQSSHTPPHSSLNQHQAMSDNATLVGRLRNAVSAGNELLKETALLAARLSALESRLTDVVPTLRRTYSLIL